MSYSEYLDWCEYDAQYNDISWQQSARLLLYLDRLFGERRTKLEDYMPTVKKYRHPLTPEQIMRQFFLMSSEVKGNI